MVRRVGLSAEPSIAAEGFNYHIMSMFRKVFFVIAAAATLACSAESVDDKVNRLYERMTPGERLAQLQGIYMTQFFDANDRLDTALCRKLMPNGIGHFSQYAFNAHKSPDQLRDMVAQMQDWLMHNTPSGVPALFHEEVLTGVNGMDATVYPQQIGLACSFNPVLAEKKAWLTGTAMRKIGGFQALSPMVDVVRDPSFNRLEESYGEDDYLSAVMGTAFVRGLQHGDLRDGIAACTKHYLGYGGGGDASEKELIEEILLPHETAIRLAGLQTVMPGYHAVGGVKCVANKYILQDILRDYLKYDGIVVSDYSSIEQIDDSLSDVERAAAALNAGNDVDFPEGRSYAYLPEAMRLGLVSPETFEAAVKRVLRHKALLGMLDEGAKLYETGHIEFDTDEERALSYELATQSVVLLKNDGILPLNKPCKVLLTGPNANTMWAMLGDYTYQAMSYFWQKRMESDQRPKIVSLLEGMNGRRPEGFELAYSRGCDWTEEVETVVETSGDPRVAYLTGLQSRMIDSGEEANPDEALKLARESDVIIAAVGENAILCGENRDRQHLRLPGRQEQFVESLIATGKQVVLVVFGGRAQVISKIADKCAAIIQAWYPGEEGGNAVADILYGKVCPSGKLSVSYPAEEIHGKLCYNESLEPDARTAYPFGYGLSYTTFIYSGLRVDKEAATDAESIAVSVTVTNTGDMDGDEIVQLYLSPAQPSDNHRPLKLQAFQRVSLAKGESKTLTFRLSPEQFGYYDQGQWTIVPGDFTVKVGASSADIRLQAPLTLTGDPQRNPLRTTYFAR
mgnify:CR=1 FL=1